MDFLVQLFKALFRRMVLQHKREYLSHKMKRNQDDLNKVVPSLTYYSQNLQEAVERGRHFQAVQSYVDVVNAYVVCMGLLAELTEQLNNENEWLDSLEGKRFEKEMEEFGPWQGYVKSYLSTHYKFAEMLILTLPTFAELLAEEPESLEELENLVSNFQDEMYEFGEQASVYLQ